MSTDNHAIARRFLEALCTGTIPAELTTDDFTAWTTSSGDLSGDKLRGGVALLASIFAKPLDITIQSSTAENDRVFVEATSYAPLIDGNEYHGNYVFAFRIRDGKVAAFAEHNNPVVVREKLGPLMKAAMEKMGA